MPQTILDLFEANCRTSAEKTLFDCPGRPAISYGLALEQVGRLASALAALGVRPGDRVAVQVDKSPDAVLLFLSCVKLGAIYLPLNTAYTGAEIDYFLDDAGPRVFVCRPQDVGSHANRATETRAIESLGANGDGTLAEKSRTAPVRLESVACGTDDPAAILYTSGTTGRSKGAVMSHGNLVSNCLALIDIWRFTSDDVLIHALPIFHTHGLFVACNIIMATGATMIFMPSFDAEQVIDHMAEATVLMGVPTFYTRLLKSSRLTREAASGFRLFISGSAPLTSETHTAFSDRTGHAILERYGMTETGMITSNPYEGKRLPGAVGFALPDVSVRVTDRETGVLLADGEIGLVELRGPNVFQGYWRMPEKTAAEFRDDGFFITGDLGMIDAEGYLHIVGRDKDLVITGGFNVYPKEIEALIDALPGVEEAAVIGLPHPDFGEGVTALVVAAPGASLEPGDISQCIAPDLARYKQPKQVIVVDELPRNAMGKVQKAELRKQYAALYK